MAPALRVTTSAMSSPTRAWTMRRTSRPASRSTERYTQGGTLTGPALVAVNEYGQRLNGAQHREGTDAASVADGPRWGEAERHARHVVSSPSPMASHRYVLVRRELDRAFALGPEDHAAKLEPVRR